MPYLNCRVVKDVLAAASWPAGLALGVRVTIHPGEAYERDGDYFGSALNRAARVRALARAGATRVSQATMEIARASLPRAVQLVDLGRRELRGLSRPERAFELRSQAGAPPSGPTQIPGASACHSGDRFSSRGRPRLCSRELVLEGPSVRRGAGWAAWRGGREFSCGMSPAPSMRAPAWVLPLVTAKPDGRWSTGSRRRSNMDFRILGQLEVFDEGRAVSLGGTKQRALLGRFLVHANETLTTDRLIDEVWGERPPANAAKTLQMQISRLRKALAADADDGLIVTREHGYQLRIDPERLDSHRFKRLSAEGARVLAGGRPESAAETLERALSLWRDAPLTDLSYEPFAQGEIARLEDLRAGTLEHLVEAKLALGRHAEVVAQLQALIAEHPYRERLRAQLMLALYRSERQADALQAYQDARRALVEEVGIEPGERLRELERAILARDPALLAAAVEPAWEPDAHGSDVSSQGGCASRLSAPPTRTIGRDGDRDAVAKLPRRADVRLATLTGAGGVGKTRPALEVARDLEPGLADGAWQRRDHPGGATHERFLTRRERNRKEKAP
jgi:DNA-binding SARP family transcriptional activator